MAGGQNPSVSCNASSLLQATVARLPYFMRAEGLEGNQLFGTEAIECLAAKVFEQKADSVLLEEIDSLMTM
eukprot:2521838-Lingulodinium_polyedra.AAC.1